MALLIAAAIPIVGHSEAPILEFAGLVEIEAGVISGDGPSSSDLVVSTVEFGVESQLSDVATAQVLFLYEEDGTPLEVDVATLALGYDGSPLSVVIGQDYLPFGAYQSALVSDSFTLELGETRETAAVLQYQQADIIGAIYTFNGDQDESDDHIQNIGARVGFVNDMLELSLDYTSNLLDSDGLQQGDYGLATGTAAVAGASVAGLLKLGTFSVYGEHLTALNPILGDGGGAEPASSHVELAMASGDFVYAIGYEMSDETAFLGLPEKRARIGLSTSIDETIWLGFELGQSEDYSAAEGGSGDSNTQFIVQLAAGF